jgi:hypothetical protein
VLSWSRLARAQTTLERRARLLIIAVALEHLLFILAPLDVLVSIDPWEVGR